MPRSFHSDAPVSKRNSLARLDLHNQYNETPRLQKIGLHLELNIFVFFKSLDLYLILIGESNNRFVMGVVLLFL